MDGPKYREHHVDKYGFDTLAQATQTIFSITALDEWMHIANPIRESPVRLQRKALPSFPLHLRRATSHCRFFESWCSDPLPGDAFQLLAPNPSDPPAPTEHDGDCGLAVLCARRGAPRAAECQPLPGHSHLLLPRAQTAEPPEHRHRCEFLSPPPMRFDNANFPRRLVAHSCAIGDRRRRTRRSSGHCWGSGRESKPPIHCTHPRQRC